MWAGLFWALTAEFTVAALFYPALTLNRSKRAAVLVCLCVGIMLAPFLIIREASAMRLFAAVSAEILCVKLYDVHIGVSIGVRPKLRAFLLFLLAWFSLVQRKRNQKADLRLLALRSAGKGIAGLAAGGAALVAVFQIDWLRQPFIVEHAAKTMAFFLALFSYADLITAMQRFSGGIVQYPVGSPFLARTPADFWRRYNRVAQQFCSEDLFKPMGRRLSPVWATLITFVLSGLFHEYVFSISVGRIQGYQMLFFLLQGCAAAATLAVKPKGWVEVAGWTTGTLAFNVMLATVFFASVNGVGQFYSRDLPAWLKGW